MQATAPRRRLDTGEPPQRESAKKLTPWRTRFRLLVVEDDTEMRRLLAATLRRDGYRVIEAPDGDAAFDLLWAGVVNGDAASLPDLVVSDIRLPVFTGLELLESLGVASRRVPVILITAFPDEATRAEALRLGAACLLEKPFSLAALRAAIGLALPGGPGSSGELDDVTS